MFDITAEAADEYTCGDYKFTVNDDGTATITDYIGTDTDITIPSTVTDEAGNGYTVAELACAAEKNGFSYYEGTELLNLTIPDGIMKIDINVPPTGGSSLLRIQNITIGADVKEINPFTFFNHELLKTITVDENNPHYESVDNVLFTEDMKTLITYANTDKGSYTVPDSVEVLSDCAFSSCVNLTEIVLPNTITEMGSYAFAGCTYVKSIDIPDGVTILSEGVFWACSNASEITIPESVTVIGRAAFDGCYNLTEVNIPSNVTIIDDYVFGECLNLVKVTLPDGITSIGEGAFMTCDIKNIEIPESVTTIKKGAFFQCNYLESMNIPDGVSVISELTFSR